MQAIALKMLQWLILTVIVPMIQKAVAGYVKSRETAKKLKDLAKINKKKAVTFEEKPSADTFEDMP